MNLVVKVLLRCGIRFSPFVGTHFWIFVCKFLTHLRMVYASSQKLDCCQWCFNFIPFIWPTSLGGLNLLAVGVWSPQYFVVNPFCALGNSDGVKCIWFRIPDIQLPVPTNFPYHEFCSITPSPPGVLGHFSCNYPLTSGVNTLVPYSPHIFYFELVHFTINVCWFVPPQMDCHFTSRVCCEFFWCTGACMKWWKRNQYNRTGKEDQEVINLFLATECFTPVDSFPWESVAVWLSGACNLCTLYASVFGVQTSASWHLRFLHWLPAGDSE